jgi:hypothetical protein
MTTDMIRALSPSLLSRFRSAVNAAGQLSSLMILVAGCGGGGGITVGAEVAGVRFLGQPPTSVVIGQAFGVSVELVGGNGQRVTSATNTVALSLTGASLNGTTSVAAVGGVATFSGLTIAAAASNLQFTATASGFSATSSGFASVDPLAPSALRFVTQPSNVNIGQTFGTSVEFVRPDGQRSTSATANVTLSIPGGSLSGTTTVAAVAGLATFTGLSVPGAASNLQITATSGTLTTTSAAFAAADPCVPVALGFPGTATASVATGGCVSSGQPSVFFRVTPTISQVNVNVTSTAFAPALMLTTDPLPADAAVTMSGSIGSGTVAYWIISPGRPYLLRVSSPGPTGSVTVTTSTPWPLTCLRRGIVAFATFDYGSILGTSDCRAADGTYNDPFLIWSPKPCVLTMTSTAFDAYLRVQNERTGAVIATNDNTGASTNAQVTLASCSAGADALEIIATTPPGVSATGDYSLRVVVVGGSTVAQESGTTPAALRIRDGYTGDRGAPDSKSTSRVDPLRFWR